MAASPGAAGCQPWCWAWLARWAFDDVRRDAGNDGRSARAAYRQCAWLSCGKFCRRFAHCRRRRGSDAGTAVTEYSKAGSGCVFSCFRVRFRRIGHAGRTPCESGRRGAFCRAGRNGSRAGGAAGRADGPADCTDGTGSASRNANRAADCHPAYADRPRSADSSAGRSSADTVIAAVVARAGYFDLGQLPEPIQQSQPIQQPQQQSQPIQQPANPLPPSFEPKPITAEISLVADPTTGEVR